MAFKSQFELKIKTSLKVSNTSNLFPGRAPSLKWLLNCESGVINPAYSVLCSGKKEKEAEIFVGNREKAAPDVQPEQVHTGMGIISFTRQ